jgi:Fur family ferric uptake transcriptional regulator
MKQKKRFQDFLSEKKLKRTSQRTLVWETLLKAKDHPSVEDIRERLIAQGHRVGLSTIYRTLKILLESGMIRQAKLDGTTRYEPLISQPNHIHFRCNRCGKTEEFSSSRIERLIREETEKNDFQAVYSRYAIFGFCRECAEMEARQTGLAPSEREQKILARDALELTLAVERRGYSFYMNASRKTRDAAGKEMFLLLAEEESEHMSKLQHEYESLIGEHGWLRREPARLPVSRQIADQIFPERELLSLDVKDGTTHLEALEIAIDLEHNSHRFFTNFAEQLEDPRGRKIFRDFANEERGHLESLRNQYKKLKKRNGPGSRKQK